MLNRRRKVLKSSSGSGFPLRASFPHSPVPSFLFSNGFKRGDTVDDVHRAPLQERVRFDRFAHTTDAHAQGGSEGMEKGGHSVDTHCGSPLPLLFHGQRYVASILDLSGSYLTRGVVANIGQDTPSVPTPGTLTFSRSRTVARFDRGARIDR